VCGIGPDILDTRIPAIVDVDAFGDPTVRRHRAPVDVFTYTNTVCIATGGDTCDVGLGIYLTADEAVALARQLDHAAALLARQSPR